jgi:hypothetical protein
MIAEIPRYNPGTPPSININIMTQDYDAASGDQNYVGLGINYPANLTRQDGAGNPWENSLYYPMIYLLNEYPPGPPQLSITNVASSNITSQSAIISWNTNLSASSQVDYGPTSLYGTTVSGPSNVLFHQVLLSSLSPSTLYHYKVTSSADTSTRSSTDYTFTTAAPVSFIEFVPDSIDFDTVAAGASDTVMLGITNTGLDTAQIDSVIITGNGFSHLGQSTFRLAQGDTVYHLVVFSPSSSFTDYPGYINVYYDNIKLKACVLKGYSTVAGAYFDSPGNRNFGSVAVDSSAVESILVKNIGHSALVLDSIYISSGDTFFAYSGTQGLNVAPGDSTRLSISFTPRTLTAYNDTLVIESNCFQRSQTRIVLNGGGREPQRAIMVFADSLLDFGPILVNNNKVLFVKTYNQGNVELSVSGVQVPSSPFNYLSAKVFTIAPGDSTTLLLQFAPVSEGSFSDSLVFQSNSRPDHNVVFYLSGTGTLSIRLKPFGRALPSRYSLGEVTPNPFTSAAYIDYTVPGSGKGTAIQQPVRMEIYDVKGRLVRILENGAKTSGYYRAFWNGRDNLGRVMPGSIYLCRMQGNNFVANKKLVIIR